ncbi:MAG: transcriptional regulator [Desulfovibrionales bacterium]|nr:MAG: transcriptional regulator [Desulfovibrionales bacterium]
MKEGDVVLAALPQADGKNKLRPVLFLLSMSPFNDLLACAIISQTKHFCIDLHEVIAPGDIDFSRSGLKTASLIRGGLLAVLPGSKLKRSRGEVSVDRRNRLMTKLSLFLLPNTPNEP